MRPQALGYLVVSAKNLEDWSIYGPDQLGLQRVDRTASTMAFRMDDRKQRLIVNADGNTTISAYGWEMTDAAARDAMAAQSPIMRAVKDFAAAGGHVLGVCNGFQIMIEAGLLPGGLLRNASLRFLSMDCRLRVERAGTAFTAHWQQGDCFRAPMAHGDGNYFADEATLDRLEGEGLVAFRYVDEVGQATDSANRNGSARNIAGILSPNLRVCGLMPHPEDLVDPLMGGEDGLPMFQSLAQRFVKA
jgi:phosphoribosylformylglycinamidine synthase